MMQGFGVHTFRLVNDAGESVFVKFHWNADRRHPFAGLGRGGEDLRRRPRLPPARPVGSASRPATIPEWELGLQIFTEEQAEQFSFDILDATKIVPEELVPLRPVGRMVLNRNPDNFFAETEQVAFCTAHVVPGHRLLQRPAAGRPHPLVRRHADLAPGRPELPRDPDQRADRAGAQQPARRHAPPGHPPRPRRRTSPTRWPAAVRSRPARRRASCRCRRACAPRTSRARCAPSPRSSPTTTRRPGCSSKARRRSEQAHIADAFRFELSQGDGAGDPRAHGGVAAQRVARSWRRRWPTGLGMEPLPEPLPRALAEPGQARGDEVAGAVADGAAGRRRDRRAARSRCWWRRRRRRRVARADAGGAGASRARWRAWSARASGRVRDRRRRDRSRPTRRWRTSPASCSTRWCCPTARRRVAALAQDGHTMEFIKDQYRHCKTILALGASQLLLLAKAGLAGQHGQEPWRRAAPG